MLEYAKNNIAITLRQLQGVQYLYNYGIEFHNCIMRFIFNNFCQYTWKYTRYYHFSRL